MKGFILTQDWRDEGGACRLAFVGTGDAGPFELRVRARPVMFVRRGAELPAGLPVNERREVELTDFDGEPVDALYFTTQKARAAVRDVLRANGTRVFESDVSAPDRFLMERFIHGGVQVEGRSREAEGLALYEAPKVQAADCTPTLTRLSLDIETGRGGGLYSIAYQFSGAGEEARRVLVVGAPEPCDETPVTFLPDERAVLKAFVKDVQRLDPDLLIGWNVIGFDLRILNEKCAALGVPFAIGRRRHVPRFSDRTGRLTVYVHGRVVVDGPTSLRAGFFSFSDFSLDTVASELLGEGKDIGGHGEEKVEEIERRYREDKPALARYNLHDCTLVTDIYEKTGLIKQMLSRVRSSGLLLDRLGRSVRAFDHIYLPHLHRAGVVAPDIDDIVPGKHAAGGLVLTPQPGLHEHVVGLDFKSLYPTVIRTFKIDPLARLRADVDGGQTPVGIAFSRTEHILPDFIESLMKQRKAAQQAGDKPLAQAVKILMNSFYGVMGSFGCRFYHHDLPSGITGTGQWILKTAKAFLEEQGYAVLYGDTDSLFVKLKDEDAGAPFEAGARLAVDVNAFFTDKLKREFEVESALELEFETYYRRIFFPAMRGGEQGAAKRYAGLVAEPDGTEHVTFTGLEIVRSDWTPLAKRFQSDLFHRYFEDRELEQWMRGFVRDLRAGLFDDELVYSRRLRKASAEYTKSTPPHVKALRMLPEDQQSRRDVAYVMTGRGPVPVSLPHADIDYDHYIDKQLAPLADMVLRETGVTFDQVLHGEQLELF